MGCETRNSKNFRLTMKRDFSSFGKSFFDSAKIFHTKNDVQGLKILLFPRRGGGCIYLFCA